MGLFISRKNMLRCPKCKGIYEISDGYTKCWECGVPLITEDEFQSCSAYKKTVECPYCHSTNTEKISAFGRALSIGVFGILSGKIGKQWHCNQCDSDF